MASGIAFNAVSDFTEHPISPAEQLWGNFLAHCTSLTESRAKEDDAARVERQKEIRALGAMTSEDALGFTIKHERIGHDICAQRTIQDAQLIRALFDRALALNPASNYVSNRNTLIGVGQQVADFNITPNRTSNHLNEAELAQGAIASDDGKRQANLIGDRVGEPRFVMYEPNTSKRKSSSKNNSLFPTRVTTMAEVDETSFLVAWPKNSDTYYILECPLCDRTFESAHGIYTHINQSDIPHASLFAPANKTFNRAVQIAGILVQDATAESVFEQNTRATQVYCTGIEIQDWDANFGRLLLV